MVCSISIATHDIIPEISGFLFYIDQHLSQCPMREWKAQIVGGCTKLSIFDDGSYNDTRRLWRPLASYTHGQEPWLKPSTTHGVLIDALITGVPGVMSSIERIGKIKQVVYYDHQSLPLL
jgi:hypothetical protein